MLINLTVPYDLCIASASQFHVYLPWGQRPFSIVSHRRFQPGDGPSRGLLCDCEIFGNLRTTFVSSSTAHRTPGRLIVSGGAEWGGSNIGIVLAVKVHWLEDGTWCSAVQCIIVCVGDEVTEIIQQSLQCIFTKTKRWTFSKRLSGGGGGGRDQIKCI